MAHSKPWVGAQVQKQNFRILEKTGHFEFITSIPWVNLQIYSKVESKFLSR